MRILVTGVAGFVGGHLVRFLREIQPQAEIYGLDKPQGTALTELPGGTVGLPVDLEDRSAVGAVVEQARPERVIHLAGQSSVGLSWADPGATLRSNILGLVHLLDAIEKRELTCRVLVVGSADEYGVVTPDQLPLKETTPLRPTSPYAVSKAAQGLLALEYAAEGRLSVVLTRTFPHTGPRRGEAFAESSFARQIAEIEAGLREPVISVGNLEAVRDYSDVRDVVRAYWALLERGVCGEAYNVCRGDGISIRGVLERLLRRASRQVEVRIDPDRLRPSDIPALVGDPGKLKRATGWEPTHSLDQTLTDLLDYWRERTGDAVAGR
jgi:GDP-4-dehydro-6-deoxy-D-mannose reductase